MATVLPELTESQLVALRSQAEAKVYRSLRDKLPADYLVLFQVGWILRQEDEQAKDGECDFVICHPKGGFICLEVKGGGIEFDATHGAWYSIDRFRNKNKINDPIQQALRAKYSIWSKLRDSDRWRSLGITNPVRGHAVFFPDIGDPSALARPDMPETLIGCTSDLRDPARLIDAAFSWWGRDSNKAQELGKKGVDIFRAVFARSLSVDALISSRLSDQEEKRLQLTSDQLRLLDFLRSRRRVSISGCAGTGKTILAVEKAKRLAAEGFRTLLTCYNRPLADNLAFNCRGVVGLEVMSFHQLCYRRIEMAKRSAGRDLLGEAKLNLRGKDLYDVQLPAALAYSLEVLPDSYDAIVCDEGQDFREEYWLPLELLLSDCEKSPFYVFFDDNQNLYSRVGTFPIQDAPFSLAVNCRNTRQIHSLAYQFYKGDPVELPELQGEAPTFESVSGLANQAKKIAEKITNLIARHRVSPGDISVLVVDAMRKSDYYDALARFSIPKPAEWGVENHGAPNSVLVDTVQRFKGLESPIVFLWIGDSADVISSSELLYVGISRAKSMLTVVGSDSACKRLYA